VQSARQNKVAFEQRARPPEPLDDFFRSQNYYLISKQARRALQ
jgi:hypothetical protein